jgi:hypothetical protein
VITRVPPVVPSDELATRPASTWSNDDPPQGLPDRRAIHLGRHWHFCLPSEQAVGTFYRDRVCWDEMQGTEAQLPTYWFKGP